MSTPTSPSALQLAKSLGGRLRTLRRANGLTLKGLAKTSGVDPATISKMERGQMLGTLESHLRLSRALGLTLAKLYAPLQGPFQHALAQALPSRQPRRMSAASTHP